jgi:hypothetical protein
MSSQAEIMIPQDEVLQIRMGRNPETLIKEAAFCAGALMRAVKERGWATNLGGKKDRLWFEAWAFLATMYRGHAARHAWLDQDHRDWRRGWIRGRGVPRVVANDHLDRERHVPE